MTVVKPLNCHCVQPGPGYSGNSSGSGDGGSGSGRLYGVDQTCGSCLDGVASLWYRIDLTATGGTCVAKYNRSFYLKWNTFYGAGRCYWTTMGSGVYVMNHRSSLCADPTHTNAGRVELFKHHPTFSLTPQPTDGTHAWYVWVLWAISPINTPILGEYRLSFGATAQNCLLTQTLPLISTANSNGIDTLAHGGTLTLGSTCTLTAI